MKVPNGRSAHVDAAKIRDYLLSSVHPIGRFKSVFFRSLGYSQDDSYLLEAGLRAHIRDFDVLRTQRNRYGTKYVVSGTLIGPSGAAAHVITVWIVLDGEDAPRFVTAYPGED